MPIDFDLRRRFDIDRVVRLFLGILFLVGMFWLLGKLSGALTPFAVAMLLAYLLNPMVDRAQGLVKNRMLAIIMVLLGLFLVVVGVGVTMTPAVVSQGEDAAALVTRYAEAHHWHDAQLPDWLQSEIRLAIDSLELGALADPATLQDAGGWIFKQVQGVLSSSFGALSGILGTIVILLYLIFILADYNAIFEGWKNYLPERYARKVLRVSKDVSDAMGTYFRAQALVALCNAVLFAFGFWLIGLPMGILLGLFVGLLNVVPYLQNVGIIPATFLALMKSLETGQSFWLILLLVLLVFAVVSIIEQAILTPRIIGEATGLNPAIILLALSVWGSLLGMLGLLIALPMTTVLVAYYRRFLMSDDAVPEPAMRDQPPMEEFHSRDSDSVDFER